MEYQVQINSIKAKLQETRARKKQQEELIMKVENQALKVSSTRTCRRVVMWWKCSQLRYQCFSACMFMWRQTGEAGRQEARAETHMSNRDG